MTATPDMRRRHKEKLRAWYQEKKAAGVCLDCGRRGSEDSDLLEYHHWQPAKKRANVSALVAQTRSVKRIEREIKRCVLVCVFCHAERHIKMDDGSGQFTIKRAAKLLRSAEYRASVDEYTQDLILNYYGSPALSRAVHESRPVYQGGF